MIEIFESIRTGSTAHSALRAFSGLNLTSYTEPSELCEAENMTLDSYPVLSTRELLGRIAPYGNVEYIDARDDYIYFFQRQYDQSGDSLQFRRISTHGGNATYISALTFQPGSDKDYFSDFNVVKYGAYYILFAKRKKDYTTRFINPDGYDVIFAQEADNRVKISSESSYFKSFINTLNKGEYVRISSLDSISGISEYNLLYEVFEDSIIIPGTLTQGEQTVNESWGLWAQSDTGKYEIKKYYNVADGSSGNLDLRWFNWLDFYAEQCHIDGTPLVSADVKYTRSAVEPSDPAYGDYWFDTLSGSLKTYDQTYEAWISVESSYIKLYCPKGHTTDTEEIDRIPQTSIDKWNALIPMFHEGDGIRVVDLQLYIAQENGTKTHYNVIPEYNTINAVGTDENGDKYIVISGMLDDRLIKGHEHVGFYREVPDMDYAFCHENRLWGCNSAKHEIYASAHGSMTNFIVFDGESYDSWAASVVSDGDFTGACSFAGYPHFFKKDKIIKVYGTNPQTFTIQELNAPGATENRTITELRGSLYYVGAEGVYYMGTSTYPELISKKLKAVQFGQIGTRYKDSYMVLNKDTDEAYIFNTAVGGWTKAKYGLVSCACYFEGITYIATNIGIKTLPRTGIEQEYGVQFSIVTTPIEVDTLERRTLSNIKIRVSAAHDCEFTVSLKYDGKGDFKEKITHNDGRLLSCEDIPIIPNRCDFFQIKIEGIGEFKLHGITYATRTR